MGLTLLNIFILIQENWWHWKKCYRSHEWSRTKRWRRGKI